MSRPSTIDGQDGTGDEGIFEKRNNGLGNLMGCSNASHRMHAGQPVALGIGFQMFTDEPIHHGRLDASGCDGIDAYTLLGEFKSRRPGEAVHSMLRRGINAHSRQTHLPCNRRGVYNCASPRVQNDRNLVLETEQDTQDVDVERVPIIFLGLLIGGQPRGSLHTGVVEGVIETTVGLDREVDQGFDVRFAAGVCGKERCDTAGGLNGFDDGFSLRMTTTGHHDFCMEHGQFMGNGFADTTGGTGNESDFVLECRFHESDFLIVTLVFRTRGSMRRPSPKETASPNTVFLALPCFSGMIENHMELRHLRYFVAVAGALNFTKAAALLRVAQPALSRQVQDLEEEIGVDLLNRSTRGVTLTAEGKLFLDEAREILRRADEAIEKTRSLARGDFGELQIGYSPSPTVELLPPALAAFQRAAPRVNVRLHDLAGNELAEGLRRGSLELAVMQRPIESNRGGLQFEALHSYPICVAVPISHPFARRRSVPLPLLASEKLVVFRRSEYADYHGLIARVLKDVTRRPEIAVECDGSSSLFTEIAAGHGVAILPLVFQKIVGTRLKLRPLTPEPAPQEVGIVRPIDGNLTPAAEKFSTQLRDAAKALR